MHDVEQLTNKIMNMNMITNMLIVNPKDNQSQIEKEIIKLNPKKAAGADFSPPNVIKDSVMALKSPLTQLFNNSLEDATQHFAFYF